MISEKVKNQIQVVQGDITKLDCEIGRASCRERV